MTASWGCNNLGVNSSAMVILLDKCGSLSLLSYFEHICSTSVNRMKTVITWEFLPKSLGMFDLPSLLVFDRISIDLTQLGLGDNVYIKS